jgi:hypothetical protein
MEMYNILCYIPGRFVSFGTYFTYLKGSVRFGSISSMIFRSWSSNNPSTCWWNKSVTQDITWDTSQSRMPSPVISMSMSLKKKEKFVLKVSRCWIRIERHTWFSCIHYFVVLPLPRVECSNGNSVRNFILFLKLMMRN